MKLSKRLNAGQVYINYSSGGTEAPFGGLKMSGNGREKGRWGLNEFLETLYFLKNIDFINLDGTNFDLNDKEYDKIKYLSKKIENKNLLLLWQFTLDNLEKIDFIKNQHQFIEMFLIRSLYLRKIKNEKKSSDSKQVDKNL